MTTETVLSSGVKVEEVLFVPCVRMILVVSEARPREWETTYVKGSPAIVPALAVRKYHLYFIFADILENLHRSLVRYSAHAVS